MSSSPQHIPSTPSLPSGPIRARIFRNGQSYIPPAAGRVSAAPPLSSPSSIELSSMCPRPQSRSAIASTVGRPDTASSQKSPGSPTLRRALQEAWLLDFPPDRLLTDLQVVDRHVRLLLPNDATIVSPSSTPPPKIARDPHIPQPDPSLWVGLYVSPVFVIMGFFNSVFNLDCRNVTQRRVTRPGSRPSFISLGWIHHRARPKPWSLSFGPGSRCGERPISNVPGCKRWRHSCWKSVVVWSG